MYIYIYIYIHTHTYMFKLCLPQMPKSSMSNSKKVREGKSTKGTLAKGHLCAYPICIVLYVYYTRSP